MQPMKRQRREIAVAAAAVVAAFMTYLVAFAILRWTTSLSESAQSSIAFLIMAVAFWAVECGYQLIPRVTKRPHRGSKESVIIGVVFGAAFSGLVTLFSWAGASAIAAILLTTVVLAVGAWVYERAK